MSIKKLFFLGLFSVIFAARLLACPCGCGAARPLSLSAAETWKFRLELSRKYQEDLVDINGALAKDHGPQGIDTTVFGLAYAINNKLSLSGQWSVERNWHRLSSSDYSAGDPSFGMQYVLFSPDLDHFYFPTVNVHASYKHSISKGKNEQSERPYLLDIHGNGVSEFVPGFSVWFAYASWSLGLSESLQLRRSYEFENEVAKETRQMGWGQQRQVTLAYTFFGFGQILGIFSSEYKTEDQVNEVRQQGSSSQRQEIELVGNIRIGVQKSLGISLKRSGFYLQNRNTSRNQTLGISYEQAI